MKTLEDRLERDSAQVRRHIAEMPARPVTVIRTLARRRRVAAATAAFAVVLGGFGATNLLLTGGSDQSVATQPDAPNEQSVTTVVDQPVTTTTIAGDTEAPRTAPLSVLPILGLDLDGWVPADAAEDDSDGGFRTLSYYLPSEEGTLMVAKLWIRGIPVGSPYEAGLWWVERSDYETIAVQGREVRLFATEDSHDFAWRETDDVVVTLSVISGGQEATREQAVAIANAVVDLSPDLWTELLAVQGEVIPASPTTTLPD